ncbi:hypothetical protein BUALT_Bualt09G0096500 [Buddleja alternifolia]|uniref:DUF7148 domain-containing protein n=1 Tax=Buddleja alternifolia TaxID=168488 RepID=A0AAV6X2J4_9LAMI|nr:hypothetical protein BUALT_Bualt09G0096500 [Buddleja alternifolia]
MASMAMKQAVNIIHSSVVKFSPTTPFVNPKSPSFISNNSIVHFLNLSEFSSKRNLVAICKASSADINNDDDGVSLGTMKLPGNTDIARFETLLFQWGNSLCQGANLPLPVPLKVDKIPGGARLNFIAVEDGKTETLAYIDCLVFPATDASSPIFRAIRNGPSKDQPPPGEPRIMRSLLDALKKCVEIARI